MDCLRVALVDSYQDNTKGQSFIPHGKLRDIMRPDMIKATLKESNITPFYAESALKAVITGGRKLFAVLVLMRRPELITNFIKGDNFQPVQLDHQLPLDTQTLKTLLKDNTAVTEFDQRQWELTAPVFTASIPERHLPKKIILPFLHDEKIGGGSYSSVYEIRIEASHQRLGQEVGQRVGE